MIREMFLSRFHQTTAILQGEDTMPSNIPRFGRRKAILILLGLRTDCCGAKFYVPFGWARGYCESCERRVW